MENKICKCETCGYTWKDGLNNYHSCITELRKIIDYIFDSINGMEEQPESINLLLARKQDSLLSEIFLKVNEIQ